MNTTTALQDELFYTYTDNFSANKCYDVFLNFSKIQKNINIKEAEKILHEEEYRYFTGLKHERRVNSFLIGRYSAKKAISALTGEKNQKKILIKNGVFNHPYIVCETCSNTQISLTHSDNLAAAVAFNDMLILGIDIEKINQGINSGLDASLTQYEKELALRMPALYNNSLIMIWTIKESLSKVLKTGLFVPFTILEVKSLEEHNGYFLSTFTNFQQYSATSFQLGSYVCSIAYPHNLEIKLDINKIKSNLYKIINTN